MPKNKKVRKRVLSTASKTKGDAFRGGEKQGELLETAQKNETDVVDWHWHSGKKLDAPACGQLSWGTKKNLGGQLFNEMKESKAGGRTGKGRDIGN